MRLRNGAALLHKLAHKALAQRGVVFQRLCHELLQVDDLRALLPQDVGKGIVLGLREGEVGDIVEQQPLEFLRHQMLQLFAGAVQQDFFQRPDLTCHTDSHKGSP